MVWWSSGSGEIELDIAKKMANFASHPGDCESTVRLAMNETRLSRQLKKLDPEVVRKVLSEYGAWDENELADDKFNLVRLVWIATGDINDGNY